METDHESKKGVPIRAVSRAIEILQIINRHGSPTIMEIQKESGLPYATVFRMIMTLQFEGLIECERSRKRYHPTELVWSLGTGFQKHDQLVARGRSILAELTSRFLWPVALSVRVGNRMIVKDSTHTQTTQTFINYYPGYALPLLNSGAGRAYVAFCPEDEREIIFNAARDSDDEDIRFALQIVEDKSFLADIRRQGFATHARLQHNETPGKTSSLAVPVFVDGVVRACLAIVYFEKAMSSDEAISRYVDPLMEAAKRIGDAAADAEE